MQKQRAFSLLALVTLLAGFCFYCFAGGAVQAEGEAVDAVEVYQNATFTVMYRTEASPGECPPASAELGPLLPWPAQAQAAMNQVVDILDNLLNSPVPIVVDACYQTDSTAGTLAFAGATQSFTQADVAALPVADVTYAVALANAIAGSDLNGGRAEIQTSVNANVDWDFCTTNCQVDGAKFDFVSTVVHEFLHGLGFSMSFDVDDPNNPTVGSFGPDITDTFVYTYNGSATVDRIIDLPNNSAELLNAFLGGSGTVVFDGPNTRAANDNNPAFVYSTTAWEAGSSMSHLDDNHPSNLGRMMNAATSAGPSSRTVDAITLMFLKDIGWSVNDARDMSDGTTYPLASHIASTAMVNHIRLGSTMTTEANPLASDGGDDGIFQLTTWTTGANGGEVTVNVQGNTGARGCFNGWADWNGDGDFEDAAEQIFTMMPLGVGSASHPFNIPGSASSSQSYKFRFRLHQDWDNDGTCDDQVAVSSTVTLMNGEVEDYDFSFAPAVADEFLFIPLITTP